MREVPLYTCGEDWCSVHVLVRTLRDHFNSSNLASMYKGTSLVKNSPSPLQDHLRALGMVLL